jgi:hypothetical protein
VLEKYNAERVKAHFSGVVVGEVTRYTLPALGALNFGCSAPWWRCDTLARSTRTASRFFAILTLEIP